MGRLHAAAAAVLAILGLHLAGLPPVASVQAAERVALVIGNDDYAHMSRLANPVRDARAIAAILKRHGFKVVERFNVDRAGFLDALDELRSEAQGADVAIAFYAGHGGEYAGRDVLAPKDMRLACDTKSLERAVRVGEVADAISGARRKAIILDACRNDPFPDCPTRGGDAAGGFRSLSRIEGRGLIISSSTSPGAVASDGSAGAHSPFAGALISRLERQPRDNLLAVLLQVSRDLLEATNGQQTPAVELRGGDPEICLVGGPCAAAGAGAGGVAASEVAALRTEIERIQREMMKQVAPAPAPARTLREIVDRARPAVVTVHVTTQPKEARSSAPAPQSGAGSAKDAKRSSQSPAAKTGKDAKSADAKSAPAPDLPDDHPLKEFFDRYSAGSSTGASTAPATGPITGTASSSGNSAQGSGFFISQQGFVVTARVVIDGASRIVVETHDGRKLDAELIGEDQRSNLAVLRVRGDGSYPFLRFADKPPQIGDPIFIISSPFGLSGTVSTGTISSLNRDIGSGPIGMVQIDASTNKGSSGGPVMNLAGEVVASADSIYSPTGGSVNITFATPGRVVEDVASQIMKSGRVRRGWLGVKIQNLERDMAMSVGLRDTKGALISEVTPKGPAEAGGLKEGDVVLTIEGKTISDSRELANVAASYPPDTVISVHIVRQAKEQILKVKLGEFPGASAPSPAAAGPAAGKLVLGMALEPTGSPGQGARIREIDGTSEAAGRGLAVGDVVLEAGGERIASQADLEREAKRVLSMGRQAILLQVQSGDQRRFVAIPLKGM